MLSILLNTEKCFSLPLIAMRVDGVVYVDGREVEDVGNEARTWLQSDFLAQCRTLFRPAVLGLRLLSAIRERMVLDNELECGAIGQSKSVQSGKARDEAYREFLDD